MAAPEAVLPRRERNKREKRTALLAAARSLFASRGFDETTTAQVAARAGVGAGTLFLHFGSKHDLLVAVFRDEMDAVVARAFATLPRRASLLGEVMHVYGSLVAVHERDPELARAFVKEMMFVSARSRAAVSEFIDRLDERVAERIALRQARRELDASAAALRVAENLFALYIARLQKALGLSERLASDELLSNLRESFGLQLRALGPRAESGRRRAAPRRRRT